jgi:hypothetical protein
MGAGWLCQYSDGATGFDSLQGLRIFLFAANHSISSGALINAWNYSSTPPMRLQGVVLN